MSKYFGKMRIQNASPHSIPDLKLNHAWSGQFVNETDYDVTIKIDNLLDPKDQRYYGQEFKMSIKELQRTMQHNLIKLVS